MFLTKKLTLVFLYVFLKIIKTSIYTLNSALLLQVHIRVGNVMIFSEEEWINQEGRMWIRQ